MNLNLLPLIEKNFDQDGDWDPNESISIRPFRIFRVHFQNMLIKDDQDLNNGKSGRDMSSPSMTSDFHNIFSGLFALLLEQGIISQGLTICFLGGMEIRSSPCLIRSAISSII